jgi:short subunit dehydrogenase-like uncharacterized protein
MERLDIVLFGATGFTGKLIVDYLATNDEAKSIKWGVSGRDVNSIGKYYPKTNYKTSFRLSKRLLMIKNH